MARQLNDKKSLIINYHGSNRAKLLVDAIDLGEIAVLHTDDEKTSALFTRSEKNGTAFLVEFPSKAYVDFQAVSGNVLTMTSATTEGMYKTYSFKQGASEVGVVEVPADKYVTGATIVTEDGVKKLSLSLANVADPVKVALTDFVYTGSEGTHIKVEISNGNVISASVVAGSISATELANSAVETAKINDGAVTTAKIADSAVSTAKVADGAVTADKLAADSVETAKIKDSAVTTAKVNDGAIIYAKVASDAIAAASGDVATAAAVGKLADALAVKDFVENKIGATNSAMTVVVEATATPTEGYLKTYSVKQGGAEVGKIDIPKDLVVTAGEVVKDPEGQAAGTYIKLTIANQTNPIYINVKDLVDVYTAAQGATEVQVEISDTNVVSATLVNGGVATAKLADGAVTTVKVADKAVSAAKLATDVNATSLKMSEAEGAKSISEEIAAVEATHAKNADGTFKTVATEAADAAKAVQGDTTSTIKDVEDAAGKAVTAVTVNGQDATIADKKATVTIDGADIKLDGYSKPAAGSEIAATDTVNEALGKLEAGKADKATTLSGYGITDAKIENGVITLGTSTITPVTEEYISSVDNTKTNVTLTVTDHVLTANINKIDGGTF